MFSRGFLCKPQSSRNCFWKHDHMFLLNPRTWFQDWFWLRRGCKVLSLKPQNLALQTMIKLLLTLWSHGFSLTWELDSEAYFGCKEDLRFWVSKQKCACCCFSMFDIIGSLWPAKLNRVICLHDEICCRMLHSFMAWESSWSLYQAHMFRLISCCVQEVRAALSFRDLLAELAP